jgi:hypothetical protein
LLQKLVESCAYTTVVATIEDVVSLLIEVSSCSVLVLLRITAKRTSTVGKVVLLPSELLQGRGNHRKKLLIGNY